MYLVFSIITKEHYKKKLDNLLKNTAVSGVQKSITGKEKYIQYDKIMLSYLDTKINDKETDIERFQDIVLGKVSDDKREIKIIRNYINEIDKENIIMNNLSDFKFHVYGIINDEKLGISYSDGSFNKVGNKASSACLTITGEDQKGLYEEFSDRIVSFKKDVRVIEDGTNNIGELTGILSCIENFDDKPVQLIVSDSQYAINSFKEWIYNWEQNSYKAYNGKEILNKDLIIEIWKKMKESKKLIIFQWVKGHDNTPLNEECDKLAKEAFNG